MEIVTITLIGIGLVFDTFAVSVSAGLIENKIRFLQAVKIALVFAVLQALMPYLGWLAGSQIAEFAKNYDHWIAFILLSFLGGKMIYESQKKEDDRKPINIYNFWVDVGLGLATSIDALIVGFSFAFLKYNIYFSALIFGFLTFLTAMIGMLIGKKTGHLVGKKAEIAGGLVLIAIGIKILLDHLL